MKFYLTYSNSYRAKDDGLPPKGTVCVLNNMEDIQAFFQNDQPVIFHPPGWQPWWAEYVYLNSAEEMESEHIIVQFPEDWQQTRWIEIYNGYRE